MPARCANSGAKPTSWTESTIAPPRARTSPRGSSRSEPRRSTRDSRAPSKSARRRSQPSKRVLPSAAPEKSASCRTQSLEGGPLHPGEAEVRDVELAVAEEDVVGLDLRAAEPGHPAA